MSKVLAFIPARGGSRGIKNKNLVHVGKKPLIEHTLNLVKKLDNILYPFVSTNDKKIINFSKSKKFKIDYIRPNYLSSSKSNIVDAINHALNWLNNSNLNFKTLIMLQPTSPLRKPSEIEKALNIFFKKKLKSLVSVTKVREHPYEIIEQNKNSWKYLKEPKKNSYQRQNFPNNYFFIDGSFYIIDIKTFLKYQKLVIKNKSNFFLLDRTWPVDIDHYDDLKVCEALLKNFKYNK